MFALLLLQWKFPKNNLGIEKSNSPLFVLRLRSTTLNPLHHCFKQVIYTGLAGVSKKTERVLLRLLLSIKHYLSTTYEHTKNILPNKKVRTTKIFPSFQIPQHNWTLWVLFKWIWQYTAKGRVQWIIKKRKCHFRSELERGSAVRLPGFKFGIRKHNL